MQSRFSGYNCKKATRQSKLLMKNIETLQKWIQPQHLERSAIDRIRNLPRQALVEGVLLENFFQEDIIDRLQHVIDEECLFNKHFKVFTDETPVPEEVFYQTPEEFRFLYRKYIGGVKPEYRMSLNWLTYVKFREFFKSVFSSYLDEITGYELELQGDFTHTHEFEHYLNKHSDVASTGKGTRRICTVLYLSRDWKPEYGGYLQMCLQDGSEKSIEAKCNRIVLFFPTPETDHYVTRHTEIARDKTRTCHVAWYRDRI